MLGSNENISMQETSRLELKTRNKVQIELMRLMISNLSEQAESKWITEYGKRVSDILDHVDNVQIRELALSGKINESARLIQDRLAEEEDEFDQASVN